MTPLSRDVMANSSKECSVSPHRAIQTGLTDTEIVLPTTFNTQGVNPLDALEKQEHMATRLFARMATEQASLNRQVLFAFDQPF